MRVIKPFVSKNQGDISLGLKDIEESIEIHFFLNHPQISKNPFLVGPGIMKGKYTPRISCF